MVDRRPADTSSRLGDGRAAIVFDGDDTLWETEPLYDKARSTAASIAASAGYSAFDFEDLQKVIDADNVRLMGLASHRFPTSSVQAYEATYPGRNAVIRGARSVGAACPAVRPRVGVLPPPARRWSIRAHRGRREKRTSVRHPW